MAACSLEYAAGIITLVIVSWLKIMPSASAERDGLAEETERPRGRASLNTRRTSTSGSQFQALSQALNQEDTPLRRLIKQY